MTESWKVWEGQVVDGKFHLREYLGESDHSSVFVTEHGEPEARKAAIKLVPADSENADLQLSRWGRAAKLLHPNLTRILQTGRCQLGDARLLYIVMEYAEENLSQIIPQRPLTPAETQEMLRPVLDALAYLHSGGFVHAHIKPSNVLASDDQLRISSDGICAIGEMKLGRGKPGVYEAPEAATRGQFPAGDVWSLGITLAETLTQQLPVWEWKGQEEAVLPKTLPAPFLDIVRGCLRRDPQLRPTVAAIGARLQPDPRAPHTAVIAKAQDRSPRRRSVAVTVALILALTLVIGAVRIFSRHSGASPVPAVVAENPAPQPNTEPPPTEPETQPSAEKATPNQTAADIAAPPPAAPLPAASSPTAVQTRVNATTSAASIAKGDVVHQVLPDVPESARNTIQGTVRIAVRVQVDPSGSVAGADFDSPGPSKYFANLAMKAARDWKFTPAKADGQDVASEWILRFHLSQDGTKAVPEETAP